VLPPRGAVGGRGTEIHQAYLTKEFLGLFRVGGKGVYYNQALTGFLGRLPLSLEGQRVVQVVMTLVLVGLTWMLISRRKGKRGQVVLEYGLVMTVLLMVNSFSWQHHLVWALLPLGAVGWWGRKKRVLAGWVWLAYLLLAANVRKPEEWQGWLSLILSHGFLGLVVLWWLQVSWLRNENQN
jgi:hypothetical protein